MILHIKLLEESFIILPIIHHVSMRPGLPLAKLLFKSPVWFSLDIKTIIYYSYDICTEPIPLSICIVQFHIQELKFN